MSLHHPIAAMPLKPGPMMQIVRSSGIGCGFPGLLDGKRFRGRTSPVPIRFVCLPSGRLRVGLPVRSQLHGQAAASRLLLVACARLPTSSGGEARAETPPIFVHPFAALRLSRSHPVRWGGRGGVAHGAGGCGPAFPSSPAVIGLPVVGRGGSIGSWHRTEGPATVVVR